ncbi:ankyrin repeat domain-containing protein [Oxalobacteraceae bacterium]|nr:ankyrin repeat domain-containing protein [Oxalobacteraceae bacterium]
MKYAMRLVLLAGCATAQAADGNSAAQRLALMSVDATPARLVQYAAQGDGNVVALLLQAGIDANAADPVRHVSALHNAAAQGHLEVMKKLLAQGARADAADWRGTTPLIAAAYYGQVEAARLLLQRGAGVNQVSKEGMTALVAAVYSGKDAMVELLLAQGASPSLPADGERPLAIAERAQRSAMSAALRRQPVGAGQ